MINRPENNGSWSLRFWANLRGIVILLIVAVVVVNAWVTIRSSLQDTKITKLSLNVSREAGFESKASRCGDCPQIGDMYTIILAGGESGEIPSIHVYVSDRYVTSCEECRVLYFVAHDIGKFYVVGSSRPRHCQINTISLDTIMASALNCGSVEYSSFDVR